MLAAGALASAAAASTLATPASGATSLPYLLAQPVCTDGTPTTGDLRGGSLNANHQYRVLVDGSGQQIASGVTSATGSFVEEAVTLPAATGPIVLRLQLAIIETGWVDTVTRTVGRCTIAADPGTVDLAELPRTVHVTGAGWPRSQTVRFAVDGVQGPSVVAPPSGDIASDVSIPVRPCGEVPLRQRCYRRHRPCPCSSTQGASSHRVFHSGFPGGHHGRRPVPCTDDSHGHPDCHPHTGGHTYVDPDYDGDADSDAHSDAGGDGDTDPHGRPAGHERWRGHGARRRLPAWSNRRTDLEAAQRHQGTRRQLRRGRRAGPVRGPVPRPAPRDARSPLAAGGPAAPSGQLAAAATTLVVSGPMEPGRNRLLGRR